MSKPRKTYPFFPCMRCIWIKNKRNQVKGEFPKILFEIIFNSKKSTIENKNIFIYLIILPHYRHYISAGDTLLPAFEKLIF
jgi:hypothetical protein